MARGGRLIRVFGVANIATRGLDGFVQFARAIDRNNRIVTTMENADGNFVDFGGDIGVALGIIRIGDAFHLGMLLAKMLGEDDGSAATWRTGKLALH